MIERDAAIERLKRDARDLDKALRLLAQAGVMSGAAVDRLSESRARTLERLRDSLRKRARGDDTMIAGWISAGAWP